MRQHRVLLCAFLFLFATFFLLLERRTVKFDVVEFVECAPLPSPPLTPRQDLQRCPQVGRRVTESRTPKRKVESRRKEKNQNRKVQVALPSTHAGDRFCCPTLSWWTDQFPLRLLFLFLLIERLSVRHLFLFFFRCVRPRSPLPLCALHLRRSPAPPLPPFLPSSSSPLSVPSPE